MVLAYVTNVLVKMNMFRTRGLCGLVGFSLAVSSRLFRIFGRARLLLVVALILRRRGVFAS